MDILLRLPDGKLARISEDHVMLTVEPAEIPIEENNPAAALYEQLVNGEFREVTTKAGRLQDVLLAFDPEDTIRIGVGCEKDGAALLLRIAGKSRTVLLSGMLVI